MLKYFHLEVNNMGIKKTLASIVLAGAMALGVGKIASANILQEIYREDFSASPGWVTNNPARYFCDGSAGNYHQEEIDGSNEYAYKVLPALKAGWHWRLEYDILPVSNSWAGDSRFGFFDSDMILWSPSFMVLNFARVDQGYMPTLEIMDNEGHAMQMHFLESPFTLNTWYHCVIDWNPLTREIYQGVINKDTGVLLGERTASVSGNFSNIDRIGMSTVGDDYAPGATGISRIDNVIVSQIPEPSTLGLLALGGLRFFTLRKSKRS